MTDLVHQAREFLGPLRPGYKYCLKIPGTLGGEYGGDNLATISLSELIAASGHIAQQIQELPDGAQVKLAIVESRPNNAFKPKPLRSTKHMADTACHVFGSTTQFGLTQVLGRT